MFIFGLADNLSSSDLWDNNPQWYFLHQLLNLQLLLYNVAPPYLLSLPSGTQLWLVANDASTSVHFIDDQPLQRRPFNWIQNQIYRMHHFTAQLEGHIRELVISKWTE